LQSWRLRCIEPESAQSGRFFGFAGRRFKTAATAAPTLAEFLALLWRHLLPALVEPPLDFVAAIIPMTAKASEEYPAENQQTEGLPEVDLMQPKERRQQPVPQMHHHFTENSDENRDA